MRIKKIEIENFRGIKSLEMDDIGDTIIIAGQNGSGKSCIFDAIRLIKSTYGGYQHNEWQQFFGEFQIQLQGKSKNIESIFNNKNMPVTISCIFELRPREHSYIIENLEELAEQTIWKELIPDAFQWGERTRSLYAAQFRQRRSEVSKRLSKAIPALKSELKKKYLNARIEIQPDSQINILDSDLISLIFSKYRPRQIGVIDFHGAQRHYGREMVSGINLNLDQQEQQYSANSLYSYNNKYNNVKSEMAGNYIKEILAEKANAEKTKAGSLNETLEELFESFFPNKKFLGPQPTVDGSLRFPVRAGDGSEHDLDELSSGEKEILYGYLRIRSSAPQDSIILLDEPELHLNPRLIRGLPEFYRRHLGEALKNQIWLVTHSDALIREAVGRPNFNVFHMTAAPIDGRRENQIRRLGGSYNELDLVLADLIGDLAAYRPGGKGLLFEGGGDSEFDKHFVLQIFSKELDGINLICGSNKMRVNLLHEVLDAAYNKGDISTKFFAIVDSDFDEKEIKTSVHVRRHSWDLYHIENYLLESRVISDVMNKVSLSDKWTAARVDDILEASARSIVPQVVYQKLRNYGNSTLVRGINASFDPKEVDMAYALHKALLRSAERVSSAMSAAASLESIEIYQQQVMGEIDGAFIDGLWRSVLPGRLILKEFVFQSQVGIAYEAFRNLIVSRMSDIGYRPPGMELVIKKILAG